MAGLIFSPKSVSGLHLYVKYTLFPEDHDLFFIPSMSSCGGTDLSPLHGDGGRWGNKDHCFPLQVLHTILNYIITLVSLHICSCCVLYIAILHAHVSPHMLLLCIIYSNITRPCLSTYALCCVLYVAILHAHVSPHMLLLCIICSNITRSCLPTYAPVVYYMYSNITRPCLSTYAPVVYYIYIAILHAHVSPHTLLLCIIYI